MGTWAGLHAPFLAAMSASTNIRVLFFLPNLSSYLDRAKMLMEVSQGLDRLILMVGRIDAPLDTSVYHRFTLLDAGFKRGNRPYNLVKANWLGRKLVRSRAVNVLHDTFGTFPPLFMIKRYLKNVTCCSSFFTLNGWRLRHVWSDVPTIRLLTHPSTAMMYYGLWLEHLTCRFADHVIVQSLGLVARLKEYVSQPRARVDVLANSVDTDFWRPLPEQAPSRDADGTPLRILFIGTIDRSRGALVLIEVLHLLKRRGIPATLTMVGAWERLTRRPAMDLIRQYGVGDQVEFSGRLPRSELLDHYHRHDLFLYQTNNDGSPRVVLEALASGLPIIASRHPGIDVIDPKGESIAFTEYGDAGRIVDLVGEFASDRREWSERARIGRRIAVERFSCKAIAQQYLAFYRSIATSQ